MSLKRRKSGRRSSILKVPKLLDEVQNFSYDERHMRKRVSFANTVNISYISRRGLDGAAHAPEAPVPQPTITVTDENLGATAPAAADNILISTPTGKRRRTSVLSDLKSQRLSIIPKVDNTFSLSDDVDEAEENFESDESPLLSSNVIKEQDLSKSVTDMIVDSPVENKDLPTLNKTNAQNVSMELTEFSSDDPPLSMSLLSPGALLGGTATRSAQNTLCEELELTCDDYEAPITEVPKANQSFLNISNNASLNLNDQSSPDCEASMDLTYVKENSQFEANMSHLPMIKEITCVEENLPEMPVIEESSHPEENLPELQEKSMLIDENTTLQLPVIDTELSRNKDEDSVHNLTSNWMDGNLSMLEAASDTVSLGSLPELHMLQSPALSIASPVRAESVVTAQMASLDIDRLRRNTALEPLDTTVSTPEAVPIAPNYSSSGNLNTTFQPDSVPYGRANATAASPSAYSKFCAFLNCNQTIVDSAHSSFSASKSTQAESFCFSHYLVQLHTQVQLLRKAIKQRLNNNKYTASHVAISPALKILYNGVSQALSAIELLRCYSEISGESGVSSAGKSLEFDEVMNSEDITGNLSTKVNWFSKMHHLLVDIVCPTVGEAMLSGEEAFGWTLVSWDKENVELALPNNNKVCLQLSLPSEVDLSVASVPIKVVSVHIQSPANNSRKSSSWKTPLIRCSNMSELPKAILQAKELLQQTT